eukprot:g1520.t1
MKKSSQNEEDDTSSFYQTLITNLCVGVGVGVGLGIALTVLAKMNSVTVSPSSPTLSLLVLPPSQNKGKSLQSNETKADEGTNNVSNAHHSSSNEDVSVKENKHSIPAKEALQRDQKSSVGESEREIPSLENKNTLSDCGCEGQAEKDFQKKKKKTQTTKSQVAKNLKTPLTIVTSEKVKLKRSKTAPGTPKTPNRRLSTGNWNDFLRELDEYRCCRNGMNEIAAKVLPENVMKKYPSIKGKIRQNEKYGSLTELFDRAKKIKPLFDKYVISICDVIKSMNPKKTITSETRVLWQDEVTQSIPYTTITLTSLKKIERARSKVANEYNGDCSKLVDIVRASIIVDTEQELDLVAKYFAENKSAGGKVIRFKNRFASPLWNGYRDALYNVMIEDFVCDYFRHYFCGNMSTCARQVELLQSLSDCQSNGDCMKAKMEKILAQEVEADLKNLSLLASYCGYLHLKWRALNKLLEVQTETHGKNDFKTLETRYQYGVCHREMDDIEKSIEVLQDVYWDTDDKLICMDDPDFDKDGLTAKFLVIRAARQLSRIFFARDPKESVEWDQRANQFPELALQLSSGSGGSLPTGTTQEEIIAETDVPKPQLKTLRSGESVASVGSIGSLDETLHDDNDHVIGLPVCYWDKTGYASYINVVENQYLEAKKVHGMNHPAALYQQLIYAECLFMAGRKHEALGTVNAALAMLRKQLKHCKKHKYIRYGEALRLFCEMGNYSDSKSEYYYQKLKDHIGQLNYEQKLY